MPHVYRLVYFIALFVLASPLGLFGQLQKNSCADPDTTPPTALCQDITVTLDENGDISIEPTDIDNMSFDDCALDTLTLNQTAFDCNDIGDNLVTLTAFDAAGNSAACDAMVSITYSANVFIDDQLISGSGSRQFVVSNILESDAQLPLGLDYSYRAGNEIILLPGFKSSLDFEAVTELCPN